MDNIPSLVRIIKEQGRMVLRLGRVMRKTLDDQGQPESDTTHTHMLALITSQILPSRLNKAVALSLAICHDLVEQEDGVGDTDSFKLTRDAHAEKERREAAGLYAMQGRVDDWVGVNHVDFILEYEKKESPEARWVWALDKIMPLLTHTQNGSLALRRRGLGREAAEIHLREKLSLLQQKAPECTDLHALAEALIAEILATYPTILVLPLSEDQMSQMTDADATGLAELRYGCLGDEGWEKPNWYFRHLISPNAVSGVLLVDSHGEISRKGLAGLTLLGLLPQSVTVESLAAIPGVVKV